MTKFDFSLQFPHYFQQAVDENTQTYQLEVVILIFRQILATNLQGIVWQQERRINNQTLGVKGLTLQWKRFFARKQV